mgnify:FL=1
MERLLGHNTLTTPGGNLTIDQIMDRVEHNKNVREIVDSLDDHLKKIKLDFFQNSPNIKKIVDAMKKIP